MKMKTRMMAWLLMLGICFGWISPVSALAAENEALVLKTKKVGSTQYDYRYDENGNCVYEEITHGNSTEKNYYTYGANGFLAEEFYYRNDTLNFSRFYDEFGNLTEEWTYDKTGNVRVYRCDAEYDAYGRLTLYTEKGPYENGEKLAATYSVASERYEYYSAPETLFFGHYEQDGNTRNGPEPIEWEILDTDGETMLLISKYALDSRVYHGKNTSVSWKDSDLRSWLNGEFLESAFTASEQDLLRSTRQESNVTDWAFVLSLEEVKQYFPSQEDRICLATKYAAGRGAYVNKTTGGSWWLLRTPGTGKNAVVSINSDGAIDRQGGTVNIKKGTVRPSIRVDLTAMKGNEKPARIHRGCISYSAGQLEGKSEFGSLLTYNDEGQLIYEQSYRGSDMEIREYAYDDHGNCTQKVCHYDSLGETFSAATFYENSYNYAGSLIKQTITTDPESEETVITYRYNAAGQMISKVTQSYGESVSDTWKYDGYGNLLEYRINGSVQEAYTYVPLSQALWEE